MFIKTDKYYHLKKTIFIVVKSMFVVLLLAFTPVKGDMINRYIQVDENNNFQSAYIQNTSDKTLHNVKVTFNTIDNSLLLIEPVLFDSLLTNKSMLLKPKVLLPNSWKRKNYTVEVVIEADDFEHFQIINIHTKANNSKFKWIGFAIASLTALMFYIIYKRYKV